MNTITHKIQMYKILGQCRFEFSPALNYSMSPQAHRILDASKANAYVNFFLPEVKRKAMETCEFTETFRNLILNTSIITTTFLRNYSENNNQYF